MQRRHVLATLAALVTMRRAAHRTATLHWFFRRQGDTVSGKSGAYCKA